MNDTINIFKKAEKKQLKLRLALIGPSGSGKTYSALAIATGLVGPAGRIAVIDTERGSASLYTDDFNFDTINLDDAFGDFSPANYVKAIKAAERAGYDAIVVDSLSHAWIGKGGALEMHDQAVDRQRTKNSYVAWREVTPDHNALVDALVQCKAHLVATIRSKTAYVQEKEGDRTVIRKVGMDAIQRDGLEYEFTVVGDMDAGTMAVSKTRCKALDKAVIKHPNGQISSTLKAWLNSGAPEPEPEAESGAEQSTTPAYISVSDVNRSAISSIQAQIDNNYFADATSGPSRIASSVTAVKEQLTAREIPEGNVKGRLKKGATALDFVKLAVAVMVAYDEEAPKVTQPELQAA